jgi:hypothetical protein
MQDDAERISAEIAARYGCPVMPGAYKLCKPHAYSWQMGGDDGPRTPQEAITTWHKNAARKRRLDVAKGEAK